MRNSATTSKSPDREIHDLAAALRSLGVGKVHATSRGVRAEISPGHPVDLAVTGVSVARPGTAKRTTTAGQPTQTVIVADAVPGAQRRELDRAGIGWLDRRGHLKLRAPGVFIDADVPGSPGVRSSLRRDPLGGPVALAVAFDALTCYPEPVSKVRPLARMLEASPAGVSQAISRLIDAGLLTETRIAAVPGLFWAVVDTWEPGWVDLGWSPKPSADLVAVGIAAAAALGAPVAAKAAPLELLATDARVLRAVLRKDAANKSSHVKPGVPIRVAIAPGPAAFEEHPDAVKVRGHRVANPTAVAASIAADKARGAEIVEAWDLVDRAW